MKNNFTKNILSGLSLVLNKKMMAFVLPFLFMQVANSQMNYVVGTCADPYVQVQGQAGSVFIGQGDDATFTNLNLPFPFTFYTTTYTQFLVNTNGHLVFLPGTARGFTNTALPTVTAGAALYPFWDDLQSNQAVTPNAGIYTRVDGVAPNRIFSIEWYQTGKFPATAGQTITFKIRLFENGNRIQYQYQDVIFGGGQATSNSGLSATVGLEGPLPAPRPSTTYSFNTASLVDGQCIEFILPTPCVPTAPANQTITAAPGTCAASAIVQVTGSTPQGCLNGTSTGLRYRVDGGPAVNVPSPFAPFTIPNLTVGTHTITYEVYLLANGALVGSSTSMIIVVDDEDPTVNCPADIFVTLDPGACSAILNFNVNATDNCPFQGPSTTSQVHGSLGTTQNNFATITFGFRNDGTTPIAITGINANLGDFPGPAFNGVVATRILFGPINGPGSTTGTPNIGAWTATPVQNINVNITQYFQTTFVPIPVANQVVLQPGQAVGIAVQATNGNFMRYSNGNQTSTNGTVSIISNGHYAGGNVAVLGNTPRMFKGSVNYAVFTPSLPVTQIFGLPSGSDFPIGTTTNCFTTTDAAGNTGSCCFDVVIAEFPNPTTTLACNDNVQVSVDSTCTAFIGTDMILEGGPYGCYDDYIVAVQGFGSGNGGVLINSTAVGQTLTVTVTDPTTGNSCWGTISVEDKIPPTIECRDVTIMCGAQLPDEPAPAISGYQTILYSGLNDLLEFPAVFNYQFDFSYLPSTPVLDADVRIQIDDHTFLPDVKIDVISPTGLIQRIFDISGCTGQEFPINTTFDDEGGVITLCADLNGGPGSRLQPLIAPGVSTPVLTNLDGQDASGVWIVRISDVFAADDGHIREVGLALLVDLPQVVPADNCGEVDVTFTDTETGDPCEGLIIVRHYVATDESGNT
nr:HYR domain-containing protein [Bacteroidota bacterium]